MAHQLSTLLSTGDAAPRAARVGLGVGKHVSHLEAFTAGLTQLLNEDPTDSSDAIKYARRLNTKLSHHLHAVHDTEEALEDFWRRYTGHGTAPGPGPEPGSRMGDGDGVSPAELTMTPNTMMGSLSLAGTMDATAHYIGERNAKNRLRAPPEFDQFSAPSAFFASKHDLLQPTSPLARPATSQGLTPVTATPDNHHHHHHKQHRQQQQQQQQQPSAHRDTKPLPVSVSKAVNAGPAARLVTGKTLDFRKVEHNNPTQKRLEEKLKRRLAGK